MDMIGAAHEVQVDGTSIAWGELGAGEPLVLLHGLLDTHRTWRRAAPLLAERFRVLMPDLPGHGASGRPDASYTLDWYAQTLADWLSELGVASAHVCGHSFGGGIAQWMAHEHRDRLRRLALVASGGLGREVAVGLRLASFPVLGARIAPLAIRYAVPVALRYWSRDYGHIEPEEIGRFVAACRVPGTDRAFQRSVQGVIDPFGQMIGWAGRGIALELPPVALFWGTADPIIPFRHARDTVARSRDVTLVSFERCGHFPHLDRVDDFASELGQFLSDPARLPARLVSP